MRKYGEPRIAVLATTDVADKDACDDILYRVEEEVERVWNTRAPNGYNAVRCGKGGRDPSPETRAKLSAAGRAPGSLANLARLNADAEGVARRATAGRAWLAEMRADPSYREPHVKRSRERLMRFNASPEAQALYTRFRFSPGRLERLAHNNTVRPARLHTAYWTKWQRRYNTDPAFREAVRQEHERRWARAPTSPEHRERLAHYNTVRSARIHVAFWIDWQHRHDADPAFRAAVLEAVRSAQT